MTDDIHSRWKPIHTALFCNLYREHLYGGTEEDYQQTRWDVARRCGVRRSTVDDWVCGRKKPSGRQVQTLIDIAVDEGFVDELVEVFERLKRGGMRAVFRGLYGTRDGDWVAGMYNLLARYGGKLAKMEAREQAKRDRRGTPTPKQRGAGGMK